MFFKEPNTVLQVLCGGGRRDAAREGRPQGQLSEKLQRRPASPWTEVRTFALAGQLPGCTPLL